mmetsp:Transcript_1145/g.2006  ORF Transcript_1145/g.2006 Transcript_1145/m.2006 type:complete len:271 (-) Transcript_1145:246-1058(-)
MQVQIAASVLSGCIIQSVANAPVAVAEEVVASSPKTRDLLSTPLNDINNQKQRRLLQKFKQRKQRMHQKQRGRESGEADVGVLASKRDIPRFLEEDDYDYFCPRDTCPEELCDCADSGGSLEECTDELANVCRAGRLGDCVFKDYVQVYEEVYCPFVSCVGEGFRENQCDCAFYELYCNRLEGEECTPYIQSDGADKKPFFGCDETELAGVCEEAHACKDRGDLQGLPELGTWTGSVMTGIRKNSGERVGGGLVAAVVTSLSMLWLMTNA